MFFSVQTYGVQKFFSMLIIAPAGISPRGEIPRRHPSNSPVYRTVLTVQIYSQYARKNLDLLELGPRGIGR